MLGNVVQIPFAFVVASFVLLSRSSMIFMFFTVFTHRRLISCRVISNKSLSLISPKKSPCASFRQWQNKKCFTHSECQTWGTGNFCCGDSCCDELPEEEEEEYEEYYYDYLDVEYIDKPWMDLDINSSEDEVRRSGNC